MACATGIHGAAVRDAPRGRIVRGEFAFGESASVLRIASAALIVAGIVGLKLAAK